MRSNLVGDSIPKPFTYITPTSTFLFLLPTPSSLSLSSCPNILPPTSSSLRPVPSSSSHHTANPSASPNKLRSLYRFPPSLPPFPLNTRDHFTFT
ncbi:hypothetical protein E2C01_035477 [Portunus trituberculatus]|uniref:Uncharacterized protein n=1 Tax=Portunus trituberculatus TaxID=210409 RepID=A0A5B7F4A4_PORTR|nr:hypothetical protein [Portunus trituberculatus]